MSQTVIGFFDSASDASRAIDRLRESGISNDRIDISGSNRGSGGPVNVSTEDRDHNTVRTTGDGRTVDAEGRNTNKFTDFFNSLFQGGDKDDEDKGRYNHVAERVSNIVTVHANTHAEAEIAAEVMDDCGAVDVNERATQTGYTGRISKNMNERDNQGNAGNYRSRIVGRSVENQYRLRDESYGSHHGNKDDQAY